ncbi:Clp protease N-terminal domain-containing protein [Micromonospora chokoriensis]|uniref:Clp protease N-terminal domain-containing protein n=1 Tax=Micromonospora chokoriensis TaxID=356851 RepID=UPI0004C42886|nr:Clp protease N-terminal domain-containing protein [Micromonospora chokoriensis]
MTATVPESWGAYQVNHVVSGALAVARSRAACRGELAPRLSDVAIAVLSAPGSLASAALAAVGILPRGLLDAWSSPDEAQFGPEARNERMKTLLARADGERRRAGDDVIGSVHLTAALAGLDDVELAPLRRARIDLDTLRTGVARASRNMTSEDRAFAPSPVQQVFLAPETPEITELQTRTNRSRSAVVKRLLDTRMPAGSNATSSPYGMVRSRRWARFHLAHQALVIATLLVALRYGMDWWLYLVLAPVFGTPTNLRTTIWLAFTAVALVLCPTPVAIALVLTVAAGAVSSWYELCMKRVDLGKPETTLRDIRRATRSAGESMLRRRLGVDDGD